jgi:hypothetical protein
MKARFLIGTFVLIVFALGLSIRAPAQKSDEKFSALAYLPHGAGPAMVGAGARVNVDLWVNSYTSDADAKVMAAALVEGGPDALLKQLENAKSIGKIRLTGRVGFYDFKLIRSHQTEGGRRIYAVGDRPVGFLEVYSGSRSQDYPFGILQLDLKKNSKGKEEGEGALLYSAKIKLLDGNSIDVESYGIGPVKLLGVRKF